MTNFILNHAPYGNELSYNGLRLAIALAKSGEPVSVFLMADAIFCALKNQETPNGYYNIERMLKILLNKKAQVFT